MNLMKRKETRMLFRLLFCLLSGILLLVSCTSQSVRSSWTNKELGAVKIEDILVVGISNDPGIRRIFETSFVDNFREKGINAIASYSIESLAIEATKENLLKVVEKANAKTVLLTHLTSRKEKTVEQQSVGQYFDAYNEPLGDGFLVANEQVTAVVKTIIDLETKIYEVESEQLVWTAVTESIDPVMTRKYMDKTTRILMKRMESDGLL